MKKCVSSSSNSIGIKVLHASGCIDVLVWIIGRLEGGAMWRERAARRRSAKGARFCCCCCCCRRRRLPACLLHAGVTAASRSRTVRARQPTCSAVSNHLYFLRTIIHSITIGPSLETILISPTRVSFSKTKKSINKRALSAIKSSVFILIISVHFSEFSTPVCTT